LDQEITYEKKAEVVQRSVERILERDSPSLETIKMQIDYDIGKVYYYWHLT
jgi:hypothetical protein